jgi:hypothetical protein
MRLRPFTIHGLLVIAVGSTAVLGCSADPNKPKLSKVSGKVTFKGKPVNNGSVIFTPTGGGGMALQTATGQLNEDGTFSLTTFNTGDGAVIGQHTATVESRGSDINELNKPRADGSIAYVLPKSQVPEKYTRADKSPLKYTVEDGKSNYFEIELQGELGGTATKKGR